MNIWIARQLVHTRAFPGIKIWIKDIKKLHNVQKPFKIGQFQEGGSQKIRTKRY